MSGVLVGFAKVIRDLTERAALAEKARSRSCRMSRMIEQILDLTRSRLAGGLQVQPRAMNLSAAITATDA